MIICIYEFSQWFPPTYGISYTGLIQLVRIIFNDVMDSVDVVKIKDLLERLN